MSDDLLKSLIPALDIAAFERRDDGSFESIAPMRSEEHTSELQSQ